MKPSTLYSCEKCGAQSPKWSGRCLECNRWGTIKEETVVGQQRSATVVGGRSAVSSALPAKTTPLTEVQKTAVARRPTGDADLDRVLGGGLVPGEVVLLAGEPGVGKSTLLLSLCSSLGGRVLYVAGEESPSQIALRAERLGASSANIAFLTETEAATVAATVEHERPALTIIDSIQTMTASQAEERAGTVGAVRAAGAIIAEMAKRTGLPVILIGQVTKDGSIAGPKTLEHLVDAVLSFQGEQHRGLRILRLEKNRFGTTDEVAIFRMTDHGLMIEENPSATLLADRRGGESGSAVTCFLEGNRPLLVEVQALASKSAYATPVRRASGYDTNRVLMILAVLEKRAGISFAGADVHVNVVGGVEIREPGADLALALALAGAATDRALDPTLVAIGEVGLGGEIRSVSRLDRRLAEAAALGFSRAVIPDSKNQMPKIETVKIKTLKEALTIAGLLG